MTAATHQTFLQLANKLASESGVTGVASSITTVAGNSGQAKRLCDWTAEAWNDIQNRYNNWRWMRSTFTFNTGANVDAYAYSAITDDLHTGFITRLRNWILIDDTESSNILSYLTSAGVSGQGYMVPIPWPYFRGLYRKGTQNSGPPLHVTVDPQNRLLLGPKPDGIYTIQGEYQMSAQAFTADGDTSEMPPEYDDLIWMQALGKYARFYAAPEVLARHQVEGMRLMRQLERDQRPDVALGAPFA